VAQEERDGFLAETQDEINEVYDMKVEKYSLITFVTNDILLYTVQDGQQLRRRDLSNDSQELFINLP